MSASSGVSPTLVFRGLTVLLSVTTTLYYFKTPADLKKKASLAGPLGPPNAEFDVRSALRVFPSLAPPPSLVRRRLTSVCLPRLLCSSGASATGSPTRSWRSP